MANIGLKFVLDTLQDTVEELEELEKTNGWYSAGRLADKLATSIEIITTEIASGNINRTSPKDDGILRKTVRDVVSETRKGSGPGPRC